MDLTGVGLDLSSCMAAGLIVISGLAILWGIKKAIRLFTLGSEPDFMTLREYSTSLYYERDDIMSDGWSHSEYQQGYKDDTEF